MSHKRHNHMNMQIGTAKISFFGTAFAYTYISPKN
jgi:hypothetical protein